MADAYIVDACRSASGRGKSNGALASVHPADLMATQLRAIVERVDLLPQHIDDVLGGVVTQFGEQGANITRDAVLLAGFPETVPGVTIDRQCGSSQQAIQFAAQAVMSGTQDIVIACGVESMSRVPMGSNSAAGSYRSSGLLKRYPNGLEGQGICAELVADKFRFDRTQLDEYATESHRRALFASQNGYFEAEIVPVALESDDGSERTHSTDETLREGVTVEVLASLKPAFLNQDALRRNSTLVGRITAGNSSPLTDGASAVIIASESALIRYGLTPRARIAAFSVIGDNPELMLMGVVPATQKVLQSAGMGIEDIDVFEVNEAFACVPLAWQSTLEVPDDRLNPVGGAIALGHPLGASGGRILATLLNTLERQGSRFGLQTMCEAGGMANAMLIERV